MKKRIGEKDGNDRSFPSIIDLEYSLDIVEDDSISGE